MDSDQIEMRPTAESPLLIGLLIDVSASMMASIQNKSGQSMNRLESFKNSFEELVAYAKELSLEDTGTIAPLVKIFAYGFGFGNPLSILFGGKGPKVRDLLNLSGASSSTVAIDYLSTNWPTYQRNLEKMATAMFGDTPMGAAFRIVRDRVRSENQSLRYTGRPVLFILSDGEPTDDLPPMIESIANEMKQDDVLIVSCYVTDEDLTEPRRLYSKPGANWPKGARLMFECSSVLPKDSVFETYMAEFKWTIEPMGRLFTQINQSEILSEFLNVVLSPLKIENDNGQPLNDIKETIRVVVSYSHQDAKYLKKDSLLGYLSGLTKEGFEFWHDERIITSEPWDEKIKTEIDKADIALVLVSQGFLNSRYCQDIEVASFLRAKSTSGLKIFPIILSPCDWKSHDWLTSTQFQPRNNSTILRHYKDKGLRHELYLKILEELRSLGEEIRASR